MPGPSSDADSGRRSWGLPLLLALLTGVVGAGAMWWVMGGRLQMAEQQAQTLQQTVTRTQEELLGHSRYTSYLTLGKHALAEHTKLLTATVVREEGVTEVIERYLLGFSSSGTVAIWYTAEYPFGYDLGPGQFDLRATADGLEVRLKKPRMITSPAVRNLRYKVLSGGVLTDEKAAVIQLYARAADEAASKGRALASDPAVMALCEKKLVEFLREFLRQQPGVRSVPHVRVVYTD